MKHKSTKKKYKQKRRKTKIKRLKKKHIGGYKHYGMDNILFRYSGLDSNNIESIDMPHGIPDYNFYKKTNYLRKSDVCPQFIMNQEGNDFCLELDKSYSSNNIIGHPIIYMDFKLEKEIYPNGLLVFYNHSHEYGNNGYEKNEFQIHEEYIKQIMALNEQFSPIHICLYWKELENSILLGLLEKYNLKYITNGHRDNNNDFIINLINNIQKYKYITSSLIGSHTWISLYLDRYFFIYGNGDPCQTDKQLYMSCSDTSKFYKNTYPMLTYENFNQNKDKTEYKKLLKELGNIKLGLDFKKNQEELKTILSQ